MKKFLQQIFASTLGSLIGLFLFLTLGATGLTFLILTAIAPNNEAKIEDRSILVFDLSTQIRDFENPTNLTQAISGEKLDTISLHQLLKSIERATKDPKIVALFLDGRKDGLENGYANLAEVRKALENFRSAGKKIIAYDVSLSERDYYLASVADRVILNPMGLMELNGLSSQQMFLKGALEKYGIDVQIIRVGEYKAAVEPYIRKDLSPENRQQTEALLKDLWDKFLTNVSNSRHVSTALLQKITDERGFLEPEIAKESGLIDEVGYFDNVVDKLQQLTGEAVTSEKDFRQIALQTYKDTNNAAITSNSSVAKVAVLYAEGSIVGGKGGLENIGSDRFAQELQMLREDDNIKAVVLRVNSPGGSATASDVILRELLLTRELKPVIVSMGNVAASGGYWIASGANRIFAEENTITGSIGVFGMLPNFQKIGNDRGVTWDVVKTGHFADIDSNFRPKTPEELKLYQKSVAKTYDLFLKKVSLYRKLPKQKVQEIAQGRVWSGKEAVKLGLVDSIGGLESAIANAAQTANLGNNWQLEEYPQQRGLENEIIDRFLKTNSTALSVKVEPLTSELLKIKQELEAFQSFDDPRGIYARLPFNWSID
jgi:protease-4